MPVVYIMKLRVGYDLHATAPLIAGVKPTAINVNVCTANNFAKSVAASVCHIDLAEEKMKIAYPPLIHRCFV